MIMDSTYVQDALEDQRQQHALDVDRLRLNVHADLGTDEQRTEVDELIGAAKKLGALEHVCAEHGITDAAEAKEFAERNYEHVTTVLTYTITLRPDVADKAKTIMQMSLESIPGVEHVNVKRDEIRQLKPQDHHA